MKGEILSVKTQISRKAPICGGDFPIRLIERLASHHGELGLSLLWDDNKDFSQKVNKDKRVYVKLKLGKTTRSIEDIH